MGLVHLDDKDEIESFLERDPYLNIYALGDLDEFFWPYTTWYGSRRGGEVQAIMLVYDGPGLPTVVAVSRAHEPLADLAASTLDRLPDAVYAHLNPGLKTVFAAAFQTESGGEHFKMSLHGPPAGVSGGEAVRLGRDDLPVLQALYDESYPGKWFDPRMLETGEYFGIRESGRLVSVAGVHVFSERYRVAALGNIVTRPERRGRGYGTQVTAALCESLVRKGIRVGLNVRADNHAALACYRKIGFVVAAPYEEYLLRRSGSNAQC